LDILFPWMEGGFGLSMKQDISNWNAFVKLSCPRVRMIVKYLYIPFLALILSACSSTSPPCVPIVKGDVIYVVEQGWHAEIGIPVEELDENLRFYRKVFSGARVIMFGYGKKTFFTAPPDTISEYFLGPVPGPAVIHVVGLRVTPVKAYPLGSTVVLTLPPGGARALSTYIWGDLAKDTAGKPMIVAPSTEPDGLFYAAESGYSLFHTCNTWTTDALHAAGLPVSGDGVIFSGQAMDRVNEVAASQCGSVR
jgi:hypothetical protein